MEAVFFLWFAGIVDTLRGSLVGLSFALGIGLGCGLLYAVLTMAENRSHTDEYADARKLRAKFTGLAFKALLPLIIFTSLVPTQKTLYIMAGGYFGQAALQSETAGKVLKIVNQQLDDTLASMIEKKSK